MRALALAGTSAIGGCSAGSDPAATESQMDEPLIAGVPANGAKLNAIGSVGVVFTDSLGATQYEAYCSASLIGKQTVLTAKHCVQFFSRDYAAGSKTVFAIGPDASAPLRLLEVVDVEGAPGDEGGFAGHGRDVGVMYLGQRASELTPLEIGGLKTQDLHKKFIEIGYGTRDNTGAHGTRRAGNVTLRATQGSIPEIIFGSFERFKAWYETGSPDTNALFATGPVAPVAFLPMARSLHEPADPNAGGSADDGGGDQDAYLQYLYQNLVLTPGDEAIFGGTPGDAQSCYGDSGAPILRADAKGNFIAYGVVSAGVGSNQLVCDYGGIDAVFGPEVQAFLKTAQNWVDPCKGVSVEGQCTGKTVQRCTSPFEGPRRLVKFNCGSLGQVCAVQPGGSAGCSDP